MTEEQAIKEYGQDQIKVYKSSFASMYSACTRNRQESRFKLITAGSEEKVVGLHGIGYGVDEMIQDLPLLSKWEQPRLTLMQLWQFTQLHLKNL